MTPRVTPRVAPPRDSPRDSPHACDPPREPPRRPDPRPPHALASTPPPPPSSHPPPHALGTCKMGPASFRNVPAGKGWAGGRDGELPAPRAPAAVRPGRPRPGQGVLNGAPHTIPLTPAF
eukprot:7380325-Prymnesium_polylepis.1